MKKLLIAAFTLLAIAATAFASSQTNINSKIGLGSSQDQILATYGTPESQSGTLRQDQIGGATRDVNPDSYHVFENGAIVLWYKQKAHRVFVLDWSDGEYRISSMTLSAPTDCIKNVCVGDNPANFLSRYAGYPPIKIGDEQVQLVIFPNLGFGFRAGPEFRKDRQFRITSIFIFRPTNSVTIGR